MALFYGAKDDLGTSALMPRVEVWDEPDGVDFRHRDLGCFFVIAV